MSSKDLDVPRAPLVEGHLLPARATASRPPAVHLAEARRSITRRLHGLRRPASEPSAARMLVLVPAHDAATSLGRTLDALLTQTRPADRVVVLVDDCTDSTEQVARRYPGITVMRVLENERGRAGALDQGWRRWHAGADLVAVVDADTVPAPDCLEQLETELAAAIRPGSVVARYAVDQVLGATPVARTLLRTHPASLTTWTTEALQADRTPYTAGARTTLFSADALRRVCASAQVPGPWHGSSADQLRRDLRALHRDTLVSAAARTHAGPVLTVRSLWDRLAHRTPGERRQRPAALAADAFRVALALALLGALVTPAGRPWSWLVPLLVLAALGLVRAVRMPNRTPRDLVAGALVVPAESYLWMRLVRAATRATP